MTNRPGTTSLSELLLVATLFAFVLSALATFASDISRLAAAQVERGRVQELVRTVRVILDGEMRHSLSAQVPAAGEDSFRLRAVRGGGVVCGVEANALLVHYRGVRQPEPEKDSVLLVTSAGAHVVGAVEAATSGEWCGGGMKLELDGPPADSSGLALLFESGTYMVGGGAVRYRRGAGGRQPLTEAILRHGGASTAGLVVAPGAVALDLVLEVDSLPRLRPRTPRLVVTRLNGHSVP